MKWLKEKVKNFISFSDCIANITEKPFSKYLNMEFLSTWVWQTFKSIYLSFIFHKHPWINELYEILFLVCYIMTCYQGISWPSQAKNLPLSWLFTLLMMLRSFWTENSLLKILSGGIFLWKGLERSVSTVPGCSKMHVIGSFFLANSTETVFDTVRIKGWRL